MAQTEKLILELMIKDFEVKGENNFFSICSNKRRGTWMEATHWPGPIGGEKPSQSGRRRWGGWHSNLFRLQLSPRPSPQHLRSETGDSLFWSQNPTTDLTQWDAEELAEDLCEPEDTTDYVAMETETWKRTQGPLKVDERSWLHRRLIICPLRWEVHEPRFSAIALQLNTY